MLHSRQDIIILPPYKFNCNRYWLSSYVKAATSGIHKSLGDMLREDSGSRCLDMKECYMKMQEGSNVFIHASLSIVGTL